MPLASVIAHFLANADWPTIFEPVIVVELDGGVNLVLDGVPVVTINGGPVITVDNS